MNFPLELLIKFTRLTFSEVILYLFNYEQCVAVQVFIETQQKWGEMGVFLTKSLLFFRELRTVCGSLDHWATDRLTLTL